MLSRSARIVLTARPLARLYATESASPLSAASPTTDSTPYGGARYNKAERSPTHRDSRTRPPRTSHVARIRQEKFDGPPPHLMTLADLSVDQIAWLLRKSIAFKFMAKELSSKAIIPSLGLKTIALLFSKRSTRTRVASESAVTLLGGHPMFLGSADIQLGVNETLKDSSRVIGSMVDGVMARVGAHEEIEELAEHSPVPIVNALSDLYHPTQILADIMALHEHYSPESAQSLKDIPNEIGGTQMNLLDGLSSVDPTACLNGKKAAWVGDTNNITNELLVTLPRMGMKFAIASPQGYDKVDPRVWRRVEESKTEGMVTLSNSPEEALKDADVVFTDTWISMGQEEEKAARLEAFQGYQITNQMVESAGAKPDWIFMHCLPRKPEEVDDEVFYGPRSLVFPEAENRKWTTAAVFDSYFGKWKV